HSAPPSFPTRRSSDLWIRLAVWLPYHADMLIVIREATRRLLSGHNPYVTYRSYDAPWDMAMPYGPALWGPFVIPQLLHVDFRIVDRKSTRLNSSHRTT